VHSQRVQNFYDEASFPVGPTTCWRRGISAQIVPAKAHRSASGPRCEVVQIFRTHTTGRGPRTGFDFAVKISAEQHGRAAVQLVGNVSARVSRAFKPRTVFRGHLHNLHSSQHRSPPQAFSANTVPAASAEFPSVSGRVLAFQRQERSLRTGSLNRRATPLGITFLPPVSAGKYLSPHFAFDHLNG